MSTRLTKLEVDAVIDVLNERLAGSAEDLRDALGIKLDEADKIMTRLERVVEKLGSKKFPKRYPK